MISQKNQKSDSVRMRTVVANDRGQIVIPDDIRRDMGIGKGTALVLIQRGKEITMKKESDFLKGMGGRR